jgi:hypothetical protein
MQHNTSTAESHTAPIPRETERQEGTTALVTRVYPKIYGGLCEKCGVIDPNAPSTYQYRLCEHYRDLPQGLTCSYCEPTKSQEEVTRISKLYVYDHPYKKDGYGRPILGCVCDSFLCQNKFNLEFGK